MAQSITVIRHSFNDLCFTVSEDKMRYSYPHTRRDCWQSVHIRIPISSIEPAVNSAPEILNTIILAKFEGRKTSKKPYLRAGVGWVLWSRERERKEKERTSPTQYWSRTLPQTKSYIEKFNSDIDPTYFTSDVEQTKHFFLSRTVMEPGRSRAETWLSSGWRDAPLALILTTCIDVTRISYSLNSTIIWDITAFRRNISTLMMVAICSSETWVDFQRPARRYTPQDSTLHNHRCDNPKFL
jgi:hypothetical protein